MKIFLVGVLAIVLVLLTAATASAGYNYLSPVNPGSVTYMSYYPTGAAYTYSAAYPTYAYPVVGTRFAARPVVAMPVVAAPMVGSYPTVVARPIIAFPNTVSYSAPVVYPAPVVIQPRFFVPGQPVRNIIRGVLP